jgi:hypothetical protein
MSKKFNINDIISERKNELDHSPLFQSKSSIVPKGDESPATHQQTPQQLAKPQATDTMIPRHHDTTVSTMQPRHHDTTIPQDEDDILDVVRKAVKQIGKEAATHRFTIDEKNLLADIEYTYKRQGLRTSENEITRIAINYFIQDYRKNGDSSLLAKILQRLNS